MASPRLPTTVRPLGYDITLRTHLDSDRPTFEAVVRTTLDVQESTHLLVFNAGSSLFLGSASVISTNVPHLPAQQDVYRSYDTSTERVTLHFGQELGKGDQVVLTVHYTGVLSSTMRGYYYASTMIDGKPVKYSACMFAVRVLTCHN
jgi:aminopeptidase N